MFLINMLVVVVLKRRTFKTWSRPPTAPRTTTRNEARIRFSTATSCATIPRRDKSKFSRNLPPSSRYINFNMIDRWTTKKQKRIVSNAISLFSNIVVDSEAKGGRLVHPNRRGQLLQHWKLKQCAFQIPIWPDGRGLATTSNQNCTINIFIPQHITRLHHIFACRVRQLFVGVLYCIIRALEQFIVRSFSIVRPCFSISKT